MKKTIYLAGAITGTTIAEHNDWRLKISELVNDISQRRVVCVNPVDHISEIKPMKYCGLKWDLNMVRHCDLMIVNLDYNDHSIGTNIEIGVAQEHNIPILMYYTKPLEVHQWHYGIAEQVFNSYDEMMNYLVLHYIAEWCA